MPKPAAGPMIGYARVSAQGQDLAQQRALLREAGTSPAASNRSPPASPAASSRGSTGILCLA